jgi:aconitate hydratase
MITLSEGGVYLVDGKTLFPDSPGVEKLLQKITGREVDRERAKQGSMSYAILNAHNRRSTGQAQGEHQQREHQQMEHLHISFDCLASHDLTYVGVIQTARASGLTRFPLPYVLTNCHNSLCVTGGTLNEDDHRFGLSAAKKYGGIFVPPHLAVIHSYIREVNTFCGSMILGSDSHTRYGALGTMGIGEGGGELAKQLLGETYDIELPQTVCVYLRGKPRPGVGPQDVALAIIGAVFKNGYVKNRVMEFVGEGIRGLSADFRQGIDVMTTETSCLSSIWQTDEVIERFFRAHGRPEAYRPLSPGSLAWYDGLVDVDLSAVKPMIALPFHPSNVHTIDEVNENPGDILRETERMGEKVLPKGASFSLTGKMTNGKIKVDQGIIAGCAGGTWENIMAAAAILKNGEVGNGAFSLSVYPASQPVALDLINNGTWAELLQAGVILRTSFCGPCFGAGDVPANRGFSIRHTTRNFPNREGSRPGEGQIASVALMDARSVAATAANGGILASAEYYNVPADYPAYHFDDGPYRSRVYSGFGRAEPETPLQYGPNIADWPAMGSLEEHLLLGIASVIHDPVTTTDELIPSGEASTYRSNPAAMARFTLSRKDPAYVERALALQALERERLEGGEPAEPARLLRELSARLGETYTLKNTGTGSLIYAVKPGDGSAREQAASCQRVLGGWANIAREYATRRYRSNLINWGMLPLTMAGEAEFQAGDYIFLPGIRAAITGGRRNIRALHISASGTNTVLELDTGDLSAGERGILAAGCLINFYKERSGARH